MKIKEEVIIIGLLIAWTLLLVGCTSQTTDNNQDNIASGGDSTPPGDQVQPQDQESADQTSDSDITKPTQPETFLQGPPQGLRGNMSAAFTEACDGKTAGDICYITMRNTTLNGTCTDLQGNITCQPDNMPPGGFNGNRTGGPRDRNNQTGGMPTGLPPGVDEVPN